MTTERRCYHCDKPTANELVCDACKPEADTVIVDSTVSHADPGDPNRFKGAVVRWKSGPMPTGGTVIVEPYHKESVDMSHWAAQGSPLGEWDERLKAYEAMKQSVDVDTKQALTVADAKALQVEPCPLCERRPVCKDHTARYPLIECGTEDCSFYGETIQGLEPFMPAAVKEWNLLRGTFAAQRKRSAEKKRVAVMEVSHDGKTWMEIQHEEVGTKWARTMVPPSVNGVALYKHSRLRTREEPGE